MKKNKKQGEHYINNGEFSQAIVDYVTLCNEYKSRDEPVPIVTHYIGACLLKIAEGLSHKSNFIQYTYREEMVMDAVENCLKAVKNYDVEAATRTGKPNAFAYFTQIAWFAFLRRIEKEKKQQDIKFKYLSQSGIEEFLIDADEDPEAAKAIMSFVDQLRGRVDSTKDKVSYVEEPEKQPRTRTKQSSDSDLAEFYDPDVYYD